MLKKRYVLIIILLISLAIFTACDNTEESVIKEQKYLSLALNNDYSVKSLTPGDGRYSYDKNSIAEIKFELNEGYQFDGWKGDAKSRLAAADDANTYQLKMQENSQLTLKTILNDFKLVTVALSDVREYSYSEALEIEDFPYNLEELRLKFNNKVNKKNELYFEIKENANSDPMISSDDYYSDRDILSIKENQIIINWKNFNSFENDKFDFGETYQLVVSETENKKIFDPELNEVDNEIIIDFTIEEPIPEKIENLVLSTENEKLELSWLKSEKNKNYQNENYVSEYIVYEFTKNGDFSVENAEREITVNLEDSAKNKIVRTIIYNKNEFKNLDLENNRYYYRVSAVNNMGNESELSEVVSTK